MFFSDRLLACASARALGQGGAGVNAEAPVGAEHSVAQHVPKAQAGVTMQYSGPSQNRPKFLIV